MKVIKRKATGVLGEMIKNMNPESLANTRKEMIKEVENQELLLKDLSVRLPYGIKINLNGGNDIWTLKGIFEGDRIGVMLILEPSFPSKDVSPRTSNWQLSQCKPYLRPMSSMTEEEILELYKIAYITWYSNSLYYKNEEWITFKDSIQNNTICFKNSIWLSNINKVIDYLNKNMFDYRGLISKDLALSTDEFNPYKE